MIELIATIILIFSFIGIGTIILRKIPVLLTVPKAPTEKKEGNLILNLKKRWEKINPFKNFSAEIFLQKVLTKIRILALRTDTKTFNWLQKLREKCLKKKIDENDNYWEKIKKIKNKK